MHIIQCHSKKEAEATVAAIILEQVQTKPSSVLGLATGKTMEKVYAELVKHGTAAFLRCSFFMLDEYLGFPDSDPSTFKSYIRKHFIHPLSLDEKNFYFPTMDFEDDIKALGGIDLQLLGIGQNGHVGFNEPGSEKDSRTRVVKLSPETISANREQFTEDFIPSEAITMGIRTIMDARKLLMLATGSSKAPIIKYLLNHHDEKKYPATFLKDHPHFTLVLEPEASSKINLKI